MLSGTSTGILTLNDSSTMTIKASTSGVVTPGGNVNEIQINNDENLQGSDLVFNTSEIQYNNILKLQNNNNFVDISSSNFSSNVPIDIIPNTTLDTLSLDSQGVFQGNSSGVIINGNLNAASLAPQGTGALIQNISYTSTDLNMPDTTINSSTRTTLVSVVFTPKTSGSSKIFMQVSFGYIIPGITGAGEFILYFTVNSTDIAQKTQTTINVAGGGCRSSTIVPMYVVYDNTGTTPLTIEVSAARLSGTNTLTVDGQDTGFFAIQEIEN